MIKKQLLNPNLVVVRNIKGSFSNLSDGKGGKHERAQR